MAVDYLQRLFEYFHYSNKSASQLAQKIPPGMKGQATPKRTENLTRWTIIVPACESFLNIIHFEIEVLVEFLLSHPRAGRGGQRRNANESRQAFRKPLDNKGAQC